MTFKRDDGRRAAAGFKGATGDCAVRAIAIATGHAYKDVYDEIALLAQKERPRGGKTRSHPRTGVWRQTVHAYLERLGWVWVSTMGIGTGCKVHLRADELPSGPIIARVTKHYVAVLDGVIHDTHECDRDGTRCVYGYWMPGA